MSDALFAASGTPPGTATFPCALGVPGVPAGAPAVPALLLGAPAVPALLLGAPAVPALLLGAPAVPAARAPGVPPPCCAICKRGPTSPAATVSALTHSDTRTAKTVTSGLLIFVS